jgi:hypothetical protein
MLLSRRKFTGLSPVRLIVGPLPSWPPRCRASRFPLGAAAGYGSAATTIEDVMIAEASASPPLSGIFLRASRAESGSGHWRVCAA